MVTMKILGFILEAIGNHSRLLSNGTIKFLLISLQDSLQSKLAKTYHLFYYLLLGSISTFRSRVLGLFKQ